MPTRRTVLRTALGVGVAAAVGSAAAIVARRPRQPRWHTDVHPPDPVQVASPKPAGVFGHGVASGEPRRDGVTLWTRVTPSGDTDEVPLNLEVSTDVEFADVIATRALVASRNDDFCVAHSLDKLEADAAYYYRFVALGATSPIGRTRTLPTDGPIRLAFAACASYGHGRFWPYGALAARTDLHAVVHLGDYIYDTPGHGHAGTYGTARQVDPPEGCVDLGDYRARYSQYRADPQLAELHRQHPFIPIWDDHEFADDPHPGGAAGHDPKLHGDWHDRFRGASQAWFEWMPVSRRSGTMWRAFSFGKVADLVVTDRLHEALHGHSNEPVAGRQRRFLLERAVRCEAKWFLLGSGAGTSTRREDRTGGWPDEIRDAFLTALDGTTLISVGGDAHRFEALTLPGTSRNRGDIAAGGEFSAGSITAPGVPLPDEGVAEHVQWADWTSRGYCVVTCTDSAAQVDFFGIDDDAIRSDEEPTERWLGGYVMDEQRHPPTEAGGPAAPLEGPPPAP